MVVFYKRQECVYREETDQLFTINVRATDNEGEERLVPALAMVSTSTVSLFDNPKFNSMEDYNEFLYKHPAGTLIDLSDFQLFSTVTHNDFIAMQNVEFEKAQAHPELGDLTPVTGEEETND